MVSICQLQGHPFVTLTTAGCRCFHHLQNSHRANKFTLLCVVGIGCITCEWKWSQEMTSQALGTRHRGIFLNVPLTCALNNDVISSELKCRVQWYDFPHFAETPHQKLIDCCLALSLWVEGHILCASSFMRFTDSPVCLAFSITLELKCSWVMNSSDSEFKKIKIIQNVDW